MLKDASLAGIDVLKAKDADEMEVPFSIEDGNTPLPFEIEATETVVLPEIQTMTEYIRRHYENEIFTELERRIRCGQLSAMLEGRLLRNPDRAIQTSPLVANLLPKKGFIVWANYRRIAECCVQAELTVELEILLTGGSGFIGTNLLEDLLSKGYEILNIDSHAPKISERNNVLKGTNLPDNIVVGSGSAILRRNYEGNSVITGNPADTVKKCKLVVRKTRALKPQRAIVSISVQRDAREYTASVKIDGNRCQLPATLYCFRKI